MLRKFQDFKSFNSERILIEQKSKLSNLSDLSQTSLYNCNHQTRIQHRTSLEIHISKKEKEEKKKKKKEGKNRRSAVTPNNTVVCIKAPCSLVCSSCNRNRIKQNTTVYCFNGE